VVQQEQQALNVLKNARMQAQNLIRNAVATVNPLMALSAAARSQAA